jgi:serine/threonine-protein kinase
MTALEDQARSLFLAALDCAPDRRPAFVAEACGGNAELRARVDQLLHAHQASGSIHGGPAASSGTIDEPITAHPGMVIGAYKLMEPIGDGGVAALKQASSGGFHDVAHVKKDADLDPLRARKDFQAWLGDLEAKTRR